MTCITQIKSHVQKNGRDKASWYAQWRTPDGRQKRKSCGPGAEGKKIAQALARKINASLILGEYDDRKESTWSEFRAEHRRLVVLQMGAATADITVLGLDHFERICRPGRMESINEKMLDEYVLQRSSEPGKHGRVAKTTINRELRSIRAALRKAHKWGYITRELSFPFQRVMQRIPTFISADEFSSLYAHASAARQPNLDNIPTADWWRGLLVMLYLTGWRISEVLSLRWEYVDLEKGTVFSPAEEQKGRRDELLPIHPVIVDHLKILRSFDEKVFPLRNGQRRIDSGALYKQFHKIQVAAGVRPKSGRYAFHDLKRGFATEQAENMDLFELQRLMKHRSLTTTQRYVAMAHRLRKSVNELTIPILRKHG